MSGKRNTPQSKHPSGPPSASRARTPQNLNATVFEHGNSASRPPSRHGSASKPARSHTNLDITGIGNLSALPNIKTSLTSPASTIDYELECDLVYCDYLQALLKQEIVTNAIDKHRDDLTDQLAIQKDNLYKSKLALQKTQQELQELEKLDQVDELLNIVDENFNKFSLLSDDFDLDGMLDHLLKLFNLACNKVCVQNVKTLEGKEDFDKLKTCLEKCIKACEKMNLAERNVGKVNELAKVVKEYQERVQSVNAQQKSLDELQNNEMHKLMKSLSDMYTAKEN